MNLSRPSYTGELRVPIQRAEVDVLTDRGPRRWTLFLTPKSSLSEIFEDDRQFLPAEEEGTIRLYARSSVMSLAIDAAQHPPEELSELGVTYEGRTIAVHLRNGDVVTGVLSAISARTRTLDIVNGHDKSVTIRADGKVIHVAKAHIERIEEVR